MQIYIFEDIIETTYSGWNVYSMEFRCFIKKKKKVYYTKEEKIEKGKKMFKIKVHQARR